MTTGGLLKLLGRTSNSHLERYQLRPPADHPALVVQRAYEPDNRIDYAVSIVDRGTGPPALAVMLAAASVEESLRTLVLKDDPHFNTTNAKLGTYADALIKAGRIGSGTHRKVLALLHDRDLACHGWFDRFDRARAHQFISSAREVLKHLPHGDQ